MIQPFRPVRVLTALSALIVLGLFLPACQGNHFSVREHEYITPSYDVNKIFLSMEGPTHTDTNVRLLPEVIPELLWVTGYEAVMVAGDGESARDQQFMCHNTLSITRGLDQHRRLFGAHPYGTRRLFTLSQGQYELQLPEGFGIPILSSEHLMLQSQVLNLNEEAIGEKVRHKVKTRFLRNTEAKKPMKPLAMFPSGIGVRVGDPSQNENSMDPDTGCAISADHLSYGKNAKGEAMTGHWVLEPGKDVRNTTLKNQFPFDTRVHYIAIHLHPFAETFEFRDKTENKSLWTGRATQTRGKIGLETLTHYSSVEGIPVFKDHEYEIVSTYNNTSGSSQTAMAFMFFYVEDKGYNPPTERAILSSDEGFCAPAKPEMLR